MSSMIEAIKYLESKFLKQENIVIIDYNDYWREFRTTSTWTTFLPKFSDIDNGSPYLRYVYDLADRRTNIDTRSDLLKAMIDIAGDNILDRYDVITGKQRKTKKVKEERLSAVKTMKPENLYRIMELDEKLTELILRAGIIDPHKLNEETMKMIFSKISTSNEKEKHYAKAAY